MLYDVAISVEGDGSTTGAMNSLIQQDGQFLQVDNICDDGDVYTLTTSNGQALTYVGKSSYNT